MEELLKTKYEALYLHFLYGHCSLKDALTAVKILESLKSEK